MRRRWRACLFTFVVVLGCVGNHRAPSPVAAATPTSSAAPPPSALASRGPSKYKIRITNERGVMPDVQFFRAGRVHRGQGRGLSQGHPDLAVEIVSPSSVRYDRVVKMKWYASIGVPEYWVVDPEACTLERLVLQDGRYSIADALEGDATFAPASFPGLEIPLAKLWIAAEEARRDFE